MVARDFGGDLNRSSLPVAHQAMLADLQALQDSYPPREPERQAHALVFLRASECLTGLYDRSVFARASTLAIAFSPPGADASDQAWPQHLEQLRNRADDIRQVLAQVEAVLAQADQVLGAGQARAAQDQRIGGFLRRLFRPAPGRRCATAHPAPMRCEPRAAIRRRTAIR